MRICIPTADDQGIQSPVSGHFAHTPYYTVFDTATRQVSVIANQEAAGNSHSCHDTGRFRDLQVDAIVCRGVGRRAVISFQQAGIDVLVTEAGTVAGVIEALGNGRLGQLSPDTACQGGGRSGCDHGHGHHS
jgi:predicted Fe-Mo cluster-binding NifX family protein